MRNLLYILGVGLICKAFIEKFLKDSISQFIISKLSDPSLYADTLFNWFSTALIGIIALSYFVLNSKNESGEISNSTSTMSESEKLAVIMKKRRSIMPKEYTSELIDDSEIEHLIECANTAPTHGKNEPWRFVVFKRDSLPLLAAFLNQWYANNADKVFKTQDEKEKALKQLENKLINLNKASHVIIICMKRYASEKNIFPEWEEIAAVSAAVQNIYLQTAAKGLAGFWSSLNYAKEARDSKEILRFLDLTHQEDKVLGAFVIGKTTDLSRFTRIPGDYKEKVEFR